MATTVSNLVGSLVLPNRDKIERLFNVEFSVISESGGLCDCELIGDRIDRCNAQLYVEALTRHRGQTISKTTYLPPFCTTDVTEEVERQSSAVVRRTTIWHGPAGVQHIVVGTSATVAIALSLLNEHVQAHITPRHSNHQTPVRDVVAQQTKSKVSRRLSMVLQRTLTKNNQRGGNYDATSDAVKVAITSCLLDQDKPTSKLTERQESVILIEDDTEEVEFICVSSDGESEDDKDVFIILSEADTSSTFTPEDQDGPDSVFNDGQEATAVEAAGDVDVLINQLEQLKTPTEAVAKRPKKKPSAAVRPLVFVESKASLVNHAEKRNHAVDEAKKKEEKLKPTKRKYKENGGDRIEHDLKKEKKKRKQSSRRHHEKRKRHERYHVSHERSSRDSRHGDSAATPRRDRKKQRLDDMALEDGELPTTTKKTSSGRCSQTPYTFSNTDKGHASGFNFSKMTPPPKGGTNRTEGDYDSSQTRGNAQPPMPVSNQRLRYIVIDGSNVAMSHGGSSKIFSCKGLRVCVEYFKARGHGLITIFLPHWRKCRPTDGVSVTNRHELDALEKEGYLVYTPSRKIGNKLVASYDDRFIVELAEREGGVIVSNDQYRDLMLEKRSWRQVIENRLLMYAFVRDHFMIPDDPLGKHGPSLDIFLSHSRPTATVAPPAVVRSVVRPAPSRFEPLKDDSRPAPTRHDSRQAPTSHVSNQVHTRHVTYPLQPRKPSWEYQRLKNLAAQSAAYGNYGGSFYSRYSDNIRF